MKNKKYTIILAFLLANSAYAGGTSIAYVPKGCIVDSAEYSTGGGDKMIQYLEVLCLFKDSSKAVYIGRIVSLGGMFGLGRITQPDKIIFREHNKDELIVK